MTTKGEKIKKTSRNYLLEHENIIYNAKVAVKKLELQMKQSICKICGTQRDIKGRSNKKTKR